MLSTTQAQVPHRKERPVVVGLLLWLVYFWASYVVMKFLVRGALMHFAGHPAAQGLAAVTEA